MTCETLNDRKFIEAAEMAGLDVAQMHEEFNAAEGETVTSCRRSVGSVKA